MSARVSIPQANLVEIPSPYVEPRVSFQTLEPRKVNNLTLIEGKTFLSTTVAGDITPAGAPDVGFFHDDTRFLSHLELKVDGHRAVVLSSSTENTFSSQIELTTGNIRLRDSFYLPENTIHIRREQLLGSDVFFDRFTFENFNLSSVKLCVELSLEADFVDVFQVRGCPRAVHGQYYRPVVERDRLSFYYR
jgi:glycogen debranching enzyme